MTFNPIGRLHEVAAEAVPAAPASDAGTPPMLRIRGLTKRYGDFLALEAVGFDVQRHSVVGIVGENGAGKSTLFNLLSGIDRPDAGSIEFFGRTIQPRNYREASSLGISRVFQEQALIPNIPVFENVLLSHEQRYARFGQVLDRRRMIATARRILQGFGLDIDVERVTGEYDFSTRQAIEIARACLLPREVLGIDSPLVLLDEPTSALAKSEEAALFRSIAAVREHGSVLFVSHRLSEVLAVCDVVHVLKDGRLVASVDPRRSSEAELHGLMVGRTRDADYYHEEAQHDARQRPIAFKCRALTLPGAYQDVTLEVREGEVLGIGGLLDSGKSLLGKGLAGIVPPRHGQVRLGAGMPRSPSLRPLVAEGLAYVPAERLAEGIVADLPVSWNTTLAGAQDLFSTPFGRWRAGLEQSTATEYVEQLSIKTAGVGAACRTLSGGNQQKVALAKWLCRSPRVMILDNPTRGIDAGAKEEIYGVVRELTARGVAIVLITDELLELIGLSNRIAVMRGGRVTSVIDAPPNAKPTERALVAAMVGA